MAKTSTKLRDFFEGKRRRCRLQEFNVLCSTADEKRLKLAIIMPLTSEPFEGTPDMISEQFLIMGKEKSTINFAKVFIEFEEANVKIFTTDTVKRALHSTISATLENFRMDAEGVDEKRAVNLLFDLRIPGSEDLCLWCYKHKHADFFLETVPQQRSFDEEKEAGDEPEKPAAAEGKRKAKQQRLM